MLRSKLLAALLLFASALVLMAAAISEGTPSQPRSELAMPISGGQGAAPSPGRPAQQTASTLESVDAPGRDLISITQRLKLHGAGNVPLVVNATTPNYAAGTRQQFYVADIDNKYYYPI